MQQIETPLATALAEVTEELLAAGAHFGPFASFHEGAAVIQEEFEELWDEVKAHKAPRLGPGHPTESEAFSLSRDKARMRAEAKQLAAMALRFMVDLC